VRVGDRSAFQQTAGDDFEVAACRISRRSSRDSESFFSKDSPDPFERERLARLTQLADPITTRRPG
jgi:hypothetical protein